MKKQNEIWKDIAGYEGYYQISNRGNVKSLDRFVINSKGFKRFYKGKVLSKILTNSGYFCVNLTIGKKRNQFFIHRLLGIYFIPNPKNLPEIDHLDAVKTNNDLHNLEWVTSEENTERAKNKGLMPKGVDNHKSKLTEIQVLDIRSSNLRNIDLSKKYNVSKTLIGYIKKRKTWTHI
jgi:hypothetical protein